MTGNDLILGVDCSLSFGIEDQGREDFFDTFNGKELVRIIDMQPIIRINDITVRLTKRQAGEMLKGLNIVWGEFLKEEAEK